MDIETIKEMWKPRVNNQKAGVEWWNGSAEKFATKALPTSEDSLAMRIIEREKMISPGCSGLDVGCGCGRFSFALEEFSVNMTATDFSPKMIEQAEIKRLERKSKVQFSIDNWHTLNLEGKGWAGRFNLVLAHMTPAIVSADTFLKLSQASNDWVLMVKPAKRTNSVLDELCSLVGAEVESQTLEETVLYAFELAWLCGYRPKLEYDKHNTETSMPLAEAIEKYTLRISSSYYLSDENREAIKKHLESIAVDGLVHEKTQTEIVAMYWQVTGCDE